MKIKNFDGKYFIDVIDNSFSYPGSIFKIWQMMKLNISKETGEDLISYILDKKNKKAFSEKSKTLDVNDIERGIKINNEINRVISENEKNNNLVEFSSIGGSIKNSVVDLFNKITMISRQSSESDESDSELSTESSELPYYDSAISLVDTMDMSSVSSVSDVKTSDLSDISSASDVLSDELSENKKSFMDIFLQNNNSKQYKYNNEPIEVSSVSSVNTSDLSNYEEDLSIKSELSDYMANSDTIGGNAAYKAIHSSKAMESISSSSIDQHLDSSIYSSEPSDTEFLDIRFPETKVTSESSEDDLDCETIDSTENLDEDSFDPNIWFSE